MEELSLRDIISVFKRRNKYFFITFLGMFALSAVFAMNWANYRSVATVEIKRSEIPQNIAVPSNLGDIGLTVADQSISQIEQKVTSTDSLAGIIKMFNLYSGSGKSVPLAVLADSMRNKIKLDFISSQVSNPAAVQKETAEQLSAIAFTLSFDYSDPVLVQKATNELVVRFLEEYSKERIIKARATSEFLGDQIKSLEKSMAEQEKEIADFQARHGESGPNVLLFNQQASANVALSLQNIESQITANEGTQGALRSQLATVDPYSRVIADGQALSTPAIQLKALEAKYAALSGQYGPEYPDVIKTRNQLRALRNQTGAKSQTSQLKAQIVDTKTNLEAAESNSGPDNPDVIALKYKLKGLEKQLAAAGGKRQHDDDVKQDADNPAYLSLTAALRSAEEQHKSLLGQKETLIVQQGKYQKAITENPVVAQQMAALSRDYDNSQIRYRELKEKKMAADMNQQLEVDGKSQLLLVTNPASLPRVTHPARLMILLGGFVCALIGGIASVIIFEAMNQSIYDSNHLASIIGTAPLVTIPYLFTQEEKQQSRRMKGNLARIMVFAGIVMIFAMLPFDSWWNVISHRFKFS